MKIGTWVLIKSRKLSKDKEVLGITLLSQTEGQNQTSQNLLSYGWSLLLQLQKKNVIP